MHAASVINHRRPCMILSAIVAYHDLSLREHRVFADALKNNLLTIKTITKQGALANLVASRSRVIIEEAPAPHSDHTHGWRWYANGRCDRLGLPRLKVNHSSPETSPGSSPEPPSAQCPAPGPLSCGRNPASSLAWCRPARGLLSGARAPVVAHAMCHWQKLKMFVEVPLPPPSWRSSFNPGRDLSLVGSVQELIPQITCIGQGSQSSDGTARGEDEAEAEVDELLASF